MYSDEYIAALRLRVPDITDLDIHKLQTRTTNGTRIEQFRLDQDNRCAICRNEWKSNKDMHLDHCHETDILRGLLCHKCNVGLGQFNDNPALLLEAVDYLRKTR